MIIGIFGYNFNHFKTIEIIKDTYFHGFNIGAVFLAPKKIFDDDGNVVSIDNNVEKNLEVIAFCDKASIPVYVVDHHDHIRIGETLKEHGVTLGLIGGARIIPHEVIKLFHKGIVNYHPGRIPETSGLDSLHRTIEANIPLCITAHLIDAKVDAGLFILEKQVEVFLDDDLNDLRKRVLMNQIELNHIVLKGIDNDSFCFPEINRPKKNNKATQEEKKKIMGNFTKWKYKWINE